ncbi:MAG TPA: hypothetical protein VIF88_02085 [Methylocystis sp.]
MTQIAVVGVCRFISHPREGAPLTSWREPRHPATASGDQHADAFAARAFDDVAHDSLAEYLGALARLSRPRTRLAGRQHADGEDQFVRY